MQRWALLLVSLRGLYFAWGGDWNVPPMGYNSWYCCSTNGATEVWLRGAYRWLQTNGFQAAGYDHLLMDDGWAVNRNPDGTIQPGTNQFPQGIVPFINEVHTNGFKFGLY